MSTTVTVGSAGHLRAGDVLAGRVRRTGSRRTTASASRRRARSGGWRKDGSAARGHSQTYILLANPSTTAAARHGHVPARERRAGREDLHGAIPTSRFNVEVNAEVPELVERELRRGDRGDQRRRHRGRAGDVLERGGQCLGRRHQRHRDPRPVTGFQRQSGARARVPGLPDDSGDHSGETSDPNQSRPCIHPWMRSTVTVW